MIKEKKATKLPLALLRFFLYAISGMLTALPIVIPSLWFIGWSAPSAMIFSELRKTEEKDTLIRAYGRGLCFFWFFGALVFYWFSELYPLDFLGFEKPQALAVVLLATVGIPLLQASVSALSLVIICFVRRRGFNRSHPLGFAVLTASLFSIFEFCHTLTFLGLPWGRLAIGQTEVPALIQSASLFGSYFITFIMVLFSALLAVSASELKDKKKMRGAVFASLAALLFLSNLIFGAVRMSLPEKGDSIRVGAIQGNIRFEDKWMGKAEYTMDTYRDLTLSAASDGAQLILWPETALPYDINESEKLTEYLTEISKEAGCPCIVTIFESEGDALYNTARLSTPDGGLDTTVYKKRHLVPFGEYVPLEQLISRVFPPLADLASTMDGIAPGDDAAIMETPYGKVGCLICFDSVYEELALDSVRSEAQLICISTNDSWFSKSSALRQHNAQAILRSVETGRYSVRAANTGISSVISSRGVIIESLGDDEMGYIIADVRLSDHRTLYSRIGNSFLILCGIYTVATVILAQTDYKKRDMKYDYPHNS